MGPGALELARAARTDSAVARASVLNAVSRACLAWHRRGHGFTELVWMAQRVEATSGFAALWRDAARLNAGSNSSLIFRIRERSAKVGLLRPESRFRAAGTWILRVSG